MSFSWGSGWWTIQVICVHGSTAFCIAFKVTNTFLIPVTKVLCNPHLTAHTLRRTNSNLTWTPWKNHTSVLVCQFVAPGLTQLWSQLRIDNFPIFLTKIRWNWTGPTRSVDLSWSSVEELARCCFSRCSLIKHTTTIHSWHWWKVIALSSHSTPQSPSCSSLVLAFLSLILIFIQKE